MKKENGFTLIELMVVVAIVGLLMGVGMPALQDFIKNDRLSSQINTLVGHLAYARSEAVTRGLPVGLCVSKDMTSCTAGSWGDGWILLVDDDGTAGPGAGDTILRVKQALSGNNTLTSTLGTSFVYDSRGFSAAGTGTFSLCDDRGVSRMKSISISNTGRVRQGGGAAC